MLSKGKLSQIKTGFKHVYGVSDIDEQELIRYGNEIIFHADKFPFEDDNAFSLRFTTISELSESDAILAYLASVPESEFSGSQTSTYGKLFELGKKYNIGYQAQGSADTKPAAPKNPASETRPDADSKPKAVSNSASDLDPLEDHNTGMASEVSRPAASTNSAASSKEPVSVTETIKTQNTQPKEETKMDAIQQLAQEAGAAGVGITVGTNVAEVSKNDKAAAKKVVEATQTDRINYSQKSKITKVLITAIDREKKAVEGKAAMGYVSQPKKAFETFVSKTGCTVEDGVVKFSKLHSSQLHDDAVKMYNLLKTAMDKPDTKVEPYFGKDGQGVQVSIKGIVINDIAGKENVLAQKEIAAHILQHAFLYLNVDSKTEAQFQLDAATTRAGSTPKKSYVVKVANKAALVEDQTVCVYVKNLTEKVSESKSGFKSALSVSCISNKLDAQSQPKKITWRIPLDVEQYDVEIVEEYKDLFKSGVGNVVKPMSASTEADIAKIVGTITNMIAAEASKASDKSIVGSSLLATLNEEKSKLVSADADAVNATLGAGGTEPEEYEG